MLVPSSLRGLSKKLREVKMAHFYNAVFIRYKPFGAYPKNCLLMKRVVFHQRGVFQRD